MAAIIIIHEAEFPHAPAYYRMCTWEPLAGGGHLQLGRIFAERNLSIEMILDTILAQIPGPGGQVITVHHANPQGIVLRLVRAHQQRASQDALNLLSSGRDAADIAGPLGLPEADVGRL